MWIVRLALRRPYTFVVASILVLVLGAVSIERTPTDIFPAIDIPIVAVFWGYTGLSPEDMSNRIVYNFERSMTSSVYDIEHIESLSLTGLSIVKVFFQPGADLSRAIAEITSVGDAAIHSMPPGTTPPYIFTYNASTVPVLQLALAGQGLDEQELYDTGVNFIRPRLVTIHGAVIPNAYGGKQRQIQVDLNTTELQAKGLSPMDVVDAVNSEDIILPAGTAKIGPFEYQVDMNGSPVTVAELNDLPVKTVGGSTIYVRDVAFVRDGNPPQTNIARVDGSRSVLMSVLKSGHVSTLDIISAVKRQLPLSLPSAPHKVNVHFIADQSKFVLASVNGVIR
jgi:multidrug efflux pump subunit AcrB